jgi:hypothetical protein
MNVRIHSSVIMSNIYSYVYLHMYVCMYVLSVGVCVREEEHRLYADMYFMYFMGCMCACKYAYV